MTETKIDLEQALLQSQANAENQAKALERIASSLEVLVQEMQEIRSHLARWAKKD